MPSSRESAPASRRGFSRRPIFLNRNAKNRYTIRNRCQIRNSPSFLLRPKYFLEFLSSLFPHPPISPGFRQSLSRRRRVSPRRSPFGGRGTRSRGEPSKQVPGVTGSKWRYPEQNPREGFSEKKSTSSDIPSAASPQEPSDDRGPATGIFPGRRWLRPICSGRCRPSRSGNRHPRNRV